MTYRLHKQKQMNMTVKKTKFKILQRKKSGQKPQKTPTAKNPKNPKKLPPKIPAKNFRAKKNRNKNFRNNKIKNFTNYNLFFQSHIQSPLNNLPHYHFQSHLVLI